MRGRRTTIAASRIARGWLLAAALSQLVACDRTRGAPPDAGVTKVPTPPPPVAAAPKGVDHLVEEGQTLWRIARAYGVPLETLLDVNSLSERDARRLTKGSRIFVPGATAPADVPTSVEDRAARDEERAALPPPTDGAYHFLADGETLWDVAHRYDRSLDELVERNGLTDDALRTLRPGTPIVVPGVTADAIRRNAERAPARPVYRHVMQPGETVWDLASLYEVGVGAIMAANDLGPEDATALRDGERVVIPGVTEPVRRAGPRSSAEVRRERPLTPRERRARANADRLGLGSRRVAGQLLTGRVDPRWEREARRAGRFPGTLLWPVTRGWFVRGYGSGEGGYHLAMDIMGDLGWNVRAAAPGVVAYSGDDVPGFGNLVVLVHDGGFVTLYAHNSINFVTAGERVSRGAILAEVGSTGISRGPHVHFELIHGGRNCDPAPLFRPHVQHRDGRRASVATATWSSRGAKPQRIACDPRRRHPRSRHGIDEDLGHEPAPASTP